MRIQKSAKENTLKKQLQLFTIQFEEMIGCYQTVQVEFQLNKTYIRSYLRASHCHGTQTGLASLFTFIYFSNISKYQERPRKVKKMIKMSF